MFTDWPVWLAGAQFALPVLAVPIADVSLVDMTGPASGAPAVSSLWKPKEMTAWSSLLEVRLLLRRCPALRHVEAIPD